MKDLDLLAAKEKFMIGTEAKKKFMDILRKDADFFGMQEVIDYSLLVGVHVKDKHPEDHTLIHQGESLSMS